MTAGLPTPDISVFPETDVFWQATKHGVLLLSWCFSCERAVWYPRAFCPGCGTEDTDWVQASGRGTIYSFTIVRRGQGAYEDSTPYVLAYVELEEGPRVLTNIVGEDAAAAEIGLKVETSFSPVSDSESNGALVRFRLVRATGDATSTGAS